MILSVDPGRDKTGCAVVEEDGSLVVKKDPLEYLRKLRFHRQVASPAEYGLSR